MTIGIAIHHKLTTTPIVLTMIGKKRVITNINGCYIAN
jgi:hypothetical protein